MNASSQGRASCHQPGSSAGEIGDNTFCNTYKTAYLKFWSFLQNLINLFSCFTKCLDNLFKHAGRLKYLNSFKVFGPRSSPSAAVPNTTVRTRKCLNSLFVSAVKVLVWHFSTVKSPSLKQPLFQHRGLKFTGVLRTASRRPGSGDSSSCREGCPHQYVSHAPGVIYRPLLTLLSETILAAQGEPPVGNIM